MDKGLEFIRLDLSDGKVWMLGEGGVGRPFLARLLLVNRGTEPLRIWDPQNSEGSQCPSVILTDAHGQQTVLRPPPIERSGVASVWTINPNQVVKIDLELLRLIGEKPLAAGDYKVRGFYQNSLDHSGGIKNVWTGYIASETYEIKLIASGRKP